MHRTRIRSAFHPLQNFSLRRRLLTIGAIRAQHRPCSVAPAALNPATKRTASEVAPRSSIISKQLKRPRCRLACASASASSCCVTGIRWLHFVMAGLDPAMTKPHGDCRVNPPVAIPAAAPPETFGHLRPAMTTVLTESVPNRNPATGQGLPHDAYKTVILSGSCRAPKGTVRRCLRGRPPPIARQGFRDPNEGAPRASGAVAAPAVSADTSDTTQASASRGRADSPHGGRHDRSARHAPATHRRLANNPRRPPT